MLSWTALNSVKGYWKSCQSTQCNNFFLRPYTISTQNFHQDSVQLHLSSLNKGLAGTSNLSYLHKDTKIWSPTWLVFSWLTVSLKNDLWILPCGRQRFAIHHWKQHLKSCYWNGWSLDESWILCHSYRSLRYPKNERFLRIFWNLCLVMVFVIPSFPINCPHSQ